MRAQHPALTIAVEKLRTATTKQTAEAARRELAEALYTDGNYRGVAKAWLGRLRMVRRVGIGTVDLADVEHEAFMCLVETPQTALPALGKSLLVHRWRAIMSCLNHWLVHQVAPVQYGNHASRRFHRRIWEAEPQQIRDLSETRQAINIEGGIAGRAIAVLHGCDSGSHVDPAPLSCYGCEGSSTDVRGRCQRCRLRRRMV